MSEPAGREASAPVPLARPSGTLEIFLTFATIAASGYGGTLVWCHRILVERKQWLSHEEFAEMFSVGQILPGPNVCNFAAMLGYRYTGYAGAAAAVAGIVALPMLLMMALGALYAAFGEISWVENALHGMAMVSAGLVLGTGIKLTKALGKRRVAWTFAGLAFVAAGLLRWPLLPVLGALAPFALYLAWREGSSR